MLVLVVFINSSLNFYICSHETVTLELRKSKSIATHPINRNNASSSPLNKADHLEIPVLAVSTIPPEVAEVPHNFTGENGNKEKPATAVSRIFH